MSRRRCKFPRHIREAPSQRGNLAEVIALRSLAAVVGEQG